MIFDVRIAFLVVLVSLSLSLSVSRFGWFLDVCRLPISACELFLVVSKHPKACAPIFNSVILKFKRIRVC